MSNKSGSSAGKGAMEIEDDRAITDQLENAVSLQELLVKPNLPLTTEDLPHELMTIVNSPGGTSGKKSAVGRHLVDPGKVGIINHNGRVQVVGPGRWMVPNPRADWIGIYEFENNVIHYESLCIVRVQKATYGLAVDNGVSIILAEGIHVRNSRFFEFKEFQPSNQKYIHHGTINLLMVPVGEYALVVENNIPKILKTGTYVIDSSFFTVKEFVNVNQEHIQHGTIHIIRVLKGKIALINNNVKPMLLHEGTHTFTSQVLTFHGVRDVNESHVVHGTITRYRIRNGEIGLAWDENKPIFIDKPDIYEVDNPNFTFVQTVPASEKQIQLGSRKRIVVYDGEVGISYVNGKLDILQPKEHIFDAAERVFVNFLSTRQQSIPLGDSSPNGHFLRCDTKDFVEIGIQAAVFYRISDPEKAVLTVGDASQIEKLVKETSTATLQVIVRSTALNQVAQSKAISVVPHEPDEKEPDDKAPLFFDMVHDEFISRLHDNFKKTYGMEIANIRVEAFKIMNNELADNISKQAIITAQTENKLANLEGQRQIATAEMERDSAVAMIKAQAASKQMATEVQAKNNANLSDAQSKAQSAKIVASGEAEALIIKAEAESKAIELRAAAEKKRAVELGGTPLGAQLAVLSIQSEMVTKSMQGVSKVIYLPSNSNMAQTPLQLFGMPSMGVPPMDGMDDDVKGNQKLIKR